MAVQYLYFWFSLFERLDILNSITHTLVLGLIIMFLGFYWFFLNLSNHLRHRPIMQTDSCWLGEPPDCQKLDPFVREYISSKDRSHWQINQSLVCPSSRNSTWQIDFEKDCKMILRGSVSLITWTPSSRRRRWPPDRGEGGLWGTARCQGGGIGRMAPRKRSYLGKLITSASQARTVEWLVVHFSMT